MGSDPYLWPEVPLKETRGWHQVDDGTAWLRPLPETAAEVCRDSRWPAFFPSSISFATTHDGPKVLLERIVGASIVNRFPLVLSLSVCRTDLSGRHHPRREFMTALERSGNATVQFFSPGPALDRVLNACSDVPEERTSSRIAYSGLSTRRAATHDAPIFDGAYLVYEGRLVSPSRDLEGQAIHTCPWHDVGSHRVYFIEICAIQLRADIAAGQSQIHWKSLPDWRPKNPVPVPPAQSLGELAGRDGVKTFQKPYTPFYVFPSSKTASFEFDEPADRLAGVHGMAIKRLPSTSAGQLERDNDRARWPCFFPSSAGMITTWFDDRTPNLMPCGSTTVVSRHPLVIAPCVSYAAVNDRYAPRATLATIRRTGRFGCGVPFIHDAVVAAMRYAGNTSILQDHDKLGHCGLEWDANPDAPLLPTLPIHFDCEVTGEVRLGTHIMFLGEVRRIRVRADVHPENPICWCPWATIKGAGNQSESGSNGLRHDFGDGLQRGRSTATASRPL